MSWVNLAWPMVASASLTLGLIHGFGWVQQRSRLAHLAFAAAAISVAALTLLELFALRATTPDQLATLIRWMHVPVAVLVFSALWFVHAFVGAGHAALGIGAGLLRACALVLNFTTGENLNFRAIDEVRHIQWWGGEVIAYPVGPANPWVWVAQLSNALLVAYLMMNVVTAWRRGNPSQRRSAAIVCGGWLLFIAIMVGSVVLTTLNAVRLPFLGAPSFLLVIAAMGYQLGSELLRSAQLSHQLEESQRQILHHERDRAQASEVAEKRLHSLFESAPVAILLVDRQGLVSMANVEAARIFGFSRYEMEGRPLERLVPHRYRDAHVGHRTAFATCPTNRAMGVGRELFGLRADGTEFPIEVGLNPVRFGDSTDILATVTDISARKRAEGEATQQRDELAHLSRVTMIGELSGSLAHELNQPLAAILSNAQAAQRILRNDPDDTGDLQDILSDIVDDDRRAGEVIRRMRSLLKKEHVEYAPVDINSVVVEVLRLIRSDLIHRGVDAGAELAHAIPPVQGDSIQLQQVLLNLIFNACDAMEGVDERRIVHVRTMQPAEGAIRVSVEDCGPGIPPEMLARIFEPFETTKDQGMGLGLAVCRTILEAHGGRIWAESTATGARVSFEIAPVSGGR